MTDPARTSGDLRFAWHPTYQGRTLRQVRDALRTDLSRDQRAYSLAMEGAEEHEQQVLASVIEMEKKWSPYDFGWAEADPAELAERIAAFEWEREQRRELFPFDEVRTARAAELAPPVEPSRPWWAFWRR
jgi:hypothetical protein